MTTILLLEDDLAIGASVQLQLELESFQVTWVQTLAEAKKKILERGSVYDLFLLDINLPDGLGYDFCLWLRDKDIRHPILFLTARTDEDSAVQAFEKGANDFIRKPFGSKELLARLKTQLSDKKPSLDIFRFAGVSLIRNQQVLKAGELLVSLNRRELEILATFFERPETVVTREQLLERLSAGDEIFDRTVDSHISHIRSKLQKKGLTGIKINSVYGQGYRLEKA